MKNRDTAERCTDEPLLGRAQKPRGRRANVSSIPEILSSGKPIRPYRKCQWGRDHPSTQRGMAVVTLPWTGIACLPDKTDNTFADDTRGL